MRFWQYVEKCGRGKAKMNTETVEQLKDMQANYMKCQAENKKLMGALIEISNMCIGDFVFDKRLDANVIGEIIYKATGLTNPQLNILDA